MSLATHCCVCGRRLGDMESSDAGMGPECRQRYRIDELKPLTHAAALAAQDGDLTRLDDLALIISEAGRPDLAAALRRRRRKPTLYIRTVGDRLEVRTPFRRGQATEYMRAWKAIPGKHSKTVNWVPANQLDVVLALLSRFFPNYFVSIDGCVRQVKRTYESNT